MARRIGRYLARHHIALLALFVALGGTSYAAIKLPANSVGTKQLKTGAVTKKKIAKATISGLKGQQGPKGDPGPPGPSTGPAGGDLTGSYPNPSIAPGVVTAAKVAADTLGGAQIDEASLEYFRAGCQLGLVHSFARIKGPAGIPSTYTTNPMHIDFVRNCAGGTAEVRRVSVGNYFVRFNGDPAALALVAVNTDDGTCAISTVNSTVVVGKVLSGADAGAFHVVTQSVSVGGYDNCVTILTF